MEKIKFNIGDRVKVIAPTSQDFPIGSTGTIQDSDWTPWVIMDDESLNHTYVEDLDRKATVFAQDELCLIEE